MNRFAEAWTQGELAGRGIIPVSELTRSQAALAGSETQSGSLSAEARAPAVACITPASGSGANTLPHPVSACNTASILSPPC